ncbi:MAG TPA: hypothetical protein VLG50_05090 [Candidatus Saccharimonadales bacterium]|nr:hypothetical protein [Candidatus Saccharimonadales bacterium]
MIQWVANPKQYDVFQVLFDQPFYTIDTPIATDDGLLVNQINTIPLYHGVYQFTIDTTHSKDDAITTLYSLLNHIDLLQLSFDVYQKMNEYVWRGLASLLKILLYKHFDYRVSHVIRNNNNIVPMIGTQPVYVSSMVSKSIHELIKMDDLIGYKTLLDLYHHHVNISDDMYVSDLIWTFDLNHFKYRNVLNVPVVEVLQDEENESRAKFYEFGYDTLQSIVSHLYHMINTITLLSNNGTLSGDWIWTYESNVKNKQLIKRAAIRAFSDYYKNDIDFLKKQNLIRIGSDLIITIPMKQDDDADALKLNINRYLSDDKINKN